MSDIQRSQMWAQRKKERKKERDCELLARGPHAYRWHVAWPTADRTHQVDNVGMGPSPLLHDLNLFLSVSRK